MMGHVLKEKEDNDARVQTIKLNEVFCTIGQMALPILFLSTSQCRLYWKPIKLTGLHFMQTTLHTHHET